MSLTATETRPTHDDQPHPAWTEGQQDAIAEERDIVLNRIAWVYDYADTEWAAEYAAGAHHVFRLIAKFRVHLATLGVEQ